MSELRIRIFQELSELDEGERERVRQMVAAWGKRHMKQPTKPLAWATRLNAVMNAAMGMHLDSFPIRVKELALDYSQQVFRDDPVVRVEMENVWAALKAA